MKCKHCNQDIRESIDPNVPFVHEQSANSFCDVAGVADAVHNRKMIGRREAEPDDQNEFTANVTPFLFSQN